MTVKERASPKNGVRLGFKRANSNPYTVYMFNKSFTLKFWRLELSRFRLVGV